MKRFALICLTVAVLGTPLFAAKESTAVIDMNRVIKIHPRTLADRAILQDVVQDYEKMRERTVTDLETRKAELEKLSGEMSDEALSDKLRSEKRELARMKFEELRQLEMDFRRKTADSQKTLTRREVQMRTRVVEAIKESITAVAEAKGFSYVLSTDGDSNNGYGTVLYHPAGVDITEAVIEQISKSTASE
jgi:Skp family chaperone for outer membrane proteins